MSNFRERGLNALGLFQQVGAALMLPVAVLPAAGLVMGIGFALTNTTLVGLVPALTDPFWVGTAGLLQTVSSIIFGSLPLIFAIGVAAGLSDNDSSAGLAGGLGLLLTCATIGFVLGITPEMMAEDPYSYATILGINTLQIGPFGGILVGVVAHGIYRAFHKTKLPDYLGFFSGKRLVPIMMTLASMVLGLVLSVVWPYVQQVFHWMGENLLSSSNPSVLNMFFYYLILALSVIFGLHHMIYPVLYYQLGSYVTADGTTVIGDIAVYFAQLADGIVPTAGIAILGPFIQCLFILPAILLAIYHTARKERRKEVGGLAFSAGFTSFLTGITEPAIFSFGFQAFPLYVVHAVFTAIGGATLLAIGTRAVSTFAGGTIDLVLSTILPGAPLWWAIPIVGLILGVLQYFVARWMIVTFNYQTPGRGAEEERAEAKAKVVADVELAAQMIDLLGGPDNLVSVNACITRLRTDVKDPALVKTAEIKRAGAQDVVFVGKNVQSIFGARAVLIRDEMKELLSGAKI